MHLGSRLDADAPRASEQLRAAHGAAMRDEPACAREPLALTQPQSFKENTARARLGSLWAVAERGEDRRL